MRVPSRRISPSFSTLLVSTVSYMSLTACGDGSVVAVEQLPHMVHQLISADSNSKTQPTLFIGSMALWTVVHGWSKQMVLSSARSHSPSSQH